MRLDWWCGFYFHRSSTFKMWCRYFGNGKTLNRKRIALWWSWSLGRIRPAHSGDGAGLWLLLRQPYPVRNIACLHVINGMDFPMSIKPIKFVPFMKNTTIWLYIGIDATGVGYGVYELVKEFCTPCRHCSLFTTQKVRPEVWCWKYMIWLSMGKLDSGAKAN